MRFTPLFFLGSVLFSLLFLTCGDDDQSTPTPMEEDYQLPPITTTGNNTFGCLLNGKVWLNEPDDYGNNLDVDYNDAHDGEFTLGVFGSSGTPESYGSLVLKTFFDSVGVYPVQQVIYGNEFREMPCRWFLERDSLPLDAENYVKITSINPGELIIAGEFAFTLIDTLCQDTLRFTEGRFDYQF